MGGRGPPLLARGVPARERPGGEHAVARRWSSGERLQSFAGARGEAPPQVALVHERIEQGRRAPLGPAVAPPVAPGVEPGAGYVGVAGAVPLGVEEGRRRGRPEGAARAGREPGRSPTQLHSASPLTG